MPTCSTPTRGLLSLLTACFLLHPACHVRAGLLEDYVARADDHFAWNVAESTEVDGFRIAHLKLTSQKWREHVWTHNLRVVIPPKVRNPDIGLVFITGSSSGTRYLEMLRLLSERAGAVAAVLTDVPNQPLYDGRKEDALIAYTFDQFARSGDPTWPLLFPMVKSAVRAMDAVQAQVKEASGADLKRFVVTGASKRGWTTWLTGAADPRVTAVAPIVIDMLNMKKQLEWAEKCYGRQSEEIKDYTDLRIHLRIDEPRIVELRHAVDPYHYRDRYTMPKLILIGTNDPYWTVDSLQHYWQDLPEPKLIYQTPNAGHDLGGAEQATQTLAAFYQMIADRQELPSLDWQFAESANGTASLHLTVNRKAEAIRLWTADSKDRDFRDDSWSSTDLPIAAGSSKAQGQVATPEAGYRAFLGEVILTSPTGHPYRLSTEAKVTPGTFR